MLIDITKRLLLYWIAFCLILLAACGESDEVVAVATLTDSAATKTIRFNPSPTLSPTKTPTETAIPRIPTKVPARQVCSPFNGVGLSELEGMVVNPFHPPRVGLDGPHQGVDLAYRLNGASMALEGLPVQAVLGGKVVTVLDERFPYGNAILIETPLLELADATQAQLEIPTPAPTRESHPALTCPTIPENPTWVTNGRSLYLLYAHMKEPALLVSGEEIKCGQELGAIGSTGNALNPHLHLELRIGPSGVQLPGMAHYDTSATAEEMANYCTWRVSGLFQLLHPMRLFTATPQGN